MKNIKKEYGTRLIISESEIQDYKPIKGKGFILKYDNPSCLDSKELIALDIYREIIVEASSHTRAQQICDLIIASLCLIQGTPSFSVKDLIVYQRNATGDEKINEWILSDELLDSPIVHASISDLPLSCKIAAKVSFREHLIHSIMKYYFSNTLHSTHVIDLSPSYNFKRSPFAYDYIRFGYAILIAYAVVEELKLEIRAKDKSPSFIKGQWNPKIKQELEERLIKAKINIREPLLWYRRGHNKTLEERKVMKPTHKVEWSNGRVRDCKIDIIDAISYLSWLRSKIIAHKFDKDIKALSVYDVGNAQHLARRLLLEHLGFWTPI